MSSDDTVRPPRPARPARRQHTHDSHELEGARRRQECHAQEEPGPSRERNAQGDGTERRRLGRASAPDIRAGDLVGRGGFIRPSLEVRAHTTDSIPSTNPLTVPSAFVERYIIPALGNLSSNDGTASLAPGQNATGSRRHRHQSSVGQDVSPPAHVGPTSAALDNTAAQEVSDRLARWVDAHHVSPPNGTNGAAAPPPLDPVRENAVPPGKDTRTRPIDVDDISERIARAVIARLPTYRSNAGSQEVVLNPRLDPGLAPPTISSYQTRDPRPQVTATAASATGPAMPSMGTYRFPTSTSAESTAARPAQPAVRQEPASGQTIEVTMRATRPSEGVTASVYADGSTNANGEVAAELPVRNTNKHLPQRPRPPLRKITSSPPLLSAPALARRLTGIFRSHHRGEQVTGNEQTASADEAAEGGASGSTGRPACNTCGAEGEALTNVPAMTKLPTSIKGVSGGVEDAAQKRGRSARVETASETSPDPSAILGHPLPHWPTPPSVKDKKEKRKEKQKSSRGAIEKITQTRNVSNSTQDTYPIGYSRQAEAWQSYWPKITIKGQTGLDVDEPEDPNWRPSVPRRLSNRTEHGIRVTKDNETEKAFRKLPKEEQKRMIEEYERELEREYERRGRFEGPIRRRLERTESTQGTDREEWPRRKDDPPRARTRTGNEPRRDVRYISDNSDDSVMELHRDRPITPLARERIVSYTYFPSPVHHLDLDDLPPYSISKPRVRFEGEHHGEDSREREREPARERGGRRNRHSIGRTEGESYSHTCTTIRSGGSGSTRWRVEESRTDGRGGKYATVGSTASSKSRTIMTEHVDMFGQLIRHEDRTIVQSGQGYGSYKRPREVGMSRRRINDQPRDSTSSSDPSSGAQLGRHSLRERDAGMQRGSDSTERDAYRRRRADSSADMALHHGFSSHRFRPTSWYS